MQYLGLFACLLPSLASAAATPWTIAATTQTSLPANATLNASVPPLVTQQGDVYLEGVSGGPVKSFGNTTSISNSIAKITAGGSPVYTIQIGGSIAIEGMSADAGGNIVVAGAAVPAGLPVTPGAFLAVGPAATSRYVCKFHSADGTPLFCTYLPGTPVALMGVTADASGSVYVLTTGSIGSLPVSAGAISSGDQEVEITAFDSTGSRLLFAAAFGGSVTDHPTAIVADAAGDTYVTGITWSPDFPGTTNGAISTLEAPNGVPFLAKVNPAGTAILYATYFHENEVATAIAVDAAGEVVAIGNSSTQTNAFVRKFSSDGASILFTQAIPGGLRGAAVSVDESGNIGITGAGYLGSLILHNAYPCGSGFLVRLDVAGDLVQATNLPASGPVTINSTGGYVASVVGGATNSQLVSVHLVDEQSAAQENAIACYFNAASFLGGAIAPGEIFSIFGLGLGPETAAGYKIDSNGRIAAALAGVEVTFDGTPAPLLYVQDQQINAIAPWNLVGKPSSTLCTSYAGRQSCSTVSVEAGSPGIFTVGNGYAAALNQNGTVNSAANPADPDSFVSLFVTGLGAMDPLPVDGEILSGPLPHLTGSVTAFDELPPGSSVPLEVSYAGPAPEEVAGVYQVNLKIPAGLGPILWVSLELETPAPLAGLYISQVVLIAAR